MTNNQKSGSSSSTPCSPSQREVLEIGLMIERSVLSVGRAMLSEYPKFDPVLLHGIYLNILISIAVGALMIRGYEREQIPEYMTLFLKQHEKVHNSLSEEVKEFLSGDN
jgi:hypothetical protein